MSSTEQQPKSITSSVNVQVGPDKAFKIFTEELDCWWLQGPINFHDASKTHFMKMESGVGGRILEIHDPEAGEGYELGCITAWEPGNRIAWTSSIDDVSVDVRFTGNDDGGTAVTVTATIIGNGDRGTSSWVRMTPVWLERWCQRREERGNEPLRLGRLAIVLHYQKPATIARWLRDVLGLDPACEIPELDTNDDHTWIEFHVGNASVVIFGDGQGAGDYPTHTPWIFVDDLDSHYAHAKSSGAHIDSEIMSHGSRTYEITDCEGHRWTIAQATPRMQ
ncbi:MAG: VOC family protein [Pseudomonadota bacterium]